jgi:hypothetical protein
VNRSNFANINRLFVLTDSENSCVFEDVNDGVGDDKTSFIIRFFDKKRKSICLKECIRQLIDRFHSVETPPPENVSI